MTDTERRGWERKEDLVLQSLQDLRLSSDAALKAVNDLKTALAVMDGRLDRAEAENREIKARLDKANAWLMGILAAMIVYGFQHIWGLLQTAQLVAK